MKLTTAHSVEVKNGWSYTYTSPHAFMTGTKENFAFSLPTFIIMLLPLMSKTFTLYSAAFDLHLTPHTFLPVTDVLWLRRYSPASHRGGLGSIPADLSGRAVYGEDLWPGAGVQRLRFRIPLGEWMFVLYSRDKETCTENVQRDSKRRNSEKINPRPVCVRYVADKVAQGQVFPPSTSGFPSHCHSTNAPYLSTEGQALEPSGKFYRKSETIRHRSYLPVRPRYRAVYIVGHRILAVDTEP